MKLGLEHLKNCVVGLDPTDESIKMYRNFGFKDWALQAYFEFNGVKN
jgi:hypothetical protein